MRYQARIQGKKNQYDNSDNEMLEFIYGNIDSQNKGDNKIQNDKYYH